MKGILKISISTLARIIRKGKAGQEPRKKTVKKFDAFQKDVIKKALYGFFERNETVTSKRLRTLLAEKHDIVISKGTLFSIINKLGFKYKKRGSHSEVICERRDLVKIRANQTISIRLKHTESEGTRLFIPTRRG